jgi:hypothetical protein
VKSEFARGSVEWQQQKHEKNDALNRRSHPFLLQHDRQHMVQAQEHSLDVDADHRVEHVVVIFGGVRPFALDPGIVEKQSMTP